MVPKCILYAGLANRQKAVVTRNSVIWYLLGRGQQMHDPEKVQ